METLKKTLEQLYYRYGIKVADFCSETENDALKKVIESGGELPPDVYEVEEYVGGHTFVFKRIHVTDITPAELNDYYHLRQLEYLSSIRKCLVFFVVLACIGLVGYLLMLLLLSR